MDVTGQRPGDKVLIIENDADISYFVRLRLEAAGYQVFEARNGRAGLREFFNCRPNLVLLDLDLPQMDGWEVCRRIRDVSEAPIVILAAKGQESEEVRGFNLGADDFITKPFGTLELLARIRSLLRRSRLSGHPDGDSMYSDAVLTIDFAQHQVFVRGNKVVLSPLEYRLLVCVVRNAGQVLTHQQLLDRVWGPEYESRSNIKQYINYLRKKVETTPEKPELILSIRAVGYRYRKPTFEMPGILAPKHRRYALNTSRDAVRKRMKKRYHRMDANAASLSQRSSPRPKLMAEVSVME